MTTMELAMAEVTERAVKGRKKPTKEKKPIVLLSIPGTKKLKRKGTKKQRTAAQKRQQPINWYERLRKFKVGKTQTLKVSMSTPGSAQVTRARLVKQSHLEGIRVTTKGAVINFAKESLA